MASAVGKPDDYSFGVLKKVCVYALPYTIYNMCSEPVMFPEPQYTYVAPA